MKIAIFLCLVFLFSCSSAQVLPSLFPNSPLQVPLVLRPGLRRLNTLKGACDKNLEKSRQTLEDIQNSMQDGETSDVTEEFLNEHREKLEELAEQNKELYRDSEDEAENLGIDTTRCKESLRTVPDHSDSYTEKVRNCISRIEVSRQSELRRLLDEVEDLQQQAEECVLEANNPIQVMRGLLCIRPVGNSISQTAKKVQLFKKKANKSQQNDANKLMEKLRRSCSMRSEFNQIKTKIYVGDKVNQCIRKLIEKKERETQETSNTSSGPAPSAATL